MVAGLCHHWGSSPRGRASSPAFPAAQVLFKAGLPELQQQAGLGYRAKFLYRLARASAAGEVDLEAFKHDSRPTAEIRKHLLTLPGIGPYAAANILVLLGRYDYVALDSWVRRIVTKGWFGGTQVSDGEILAAFERFGKWQALVYWFWDWEMPYQNG